MSDIIRRIGIALLIAFAAFPLVTVLAVGGEMYGGNLHENISEKAEKRIEKKTAEAAKKADGKGAVQVITPARSGMCRLARVMSVVSLISFVLYFATKSDAAPFWNSDHEIFFACAGILSLVFTVFAVFQI